jgi:hypothetical protein
MNLPRYGNDHAVPELRGKLMSFAWPGGYPIVYLTALDFVLCPDCANGGGDCEDEPVTADIYWEGAPMTCDHCETKIESAYGDPDAEEK